jgi:hypothetical protein
VQEHHGSRNGIALLVVGVLAFGIKDSSHAVDLTAIGYLCWPEESWRSSSR